MENKINVAFFFIIDRLPIVGILLTSIYKRYKSDPFLSERNTNIYLNFKYSSPFHESTTCLHTNSFCSQK